MKDIYDLIVGESVQISGLDDMFEPLFLTRVPGGWLSERHCKNNNISSCFIPFDNEFQK